MHILISMIQFAHFLTNVFSHAHLEWFANRKKSKGKYDNNVAKTAEASYCWQTVWYYSLIYTSVHVMMYLFRDLWVHILQSWDKIATQLQSPWIKTIQPQHSDHVIRSIRLSYKLNYIIDAWAYQSVAYPSLVHCSHCWYPATRPYVSRLFRSGVKLILWSVSSV